MDYRLEQWINAPAGHQPLLDALMVFAASRGELIFIGAIALWFLFGWVRGQASDREGAIAGLIGAGAALLVNQVFIHTWTRPRPFVAHPDTVHLLLPHSTDPSFPSDHASPAFAIAGIIFALHRRAGIAALVFAAWMSYARVYVGDHYPGDVAAGAVIGTVVAWVITRWMAPVTAALRALVDRVILWLRLPLPEGTAREHASTASRS